MKFLEMEIVIIKIKRKFEKRFTDRSICPEVLCKIYFLENYLSRGALQNILPRKFYSIHRRTTRVSFS